MIFEYIYYYFVIGDGPGPNNSLGYGSTAATSVCIQIKYTRALKNNGLFYIFQIVIRIIMNTILYNDYFNNNNDNILSDRIPIFI